MSTGRLSTAASVVVTPMITHRLKLEDVSEAGDLLVDHPDKALGVILDMDGQ